MYKKKQFGWLCVSLIIQNEKRMLLARFEPKAFGVQTQCLHQWATEACLTVKSHGIYWQSAFLVST